MGTSLCTGDYLRVEMANLLKMIENEFVKKYGGDAKSVGNMLLNNSNECIAGSREKPTSATFSMHMFGLAVDVNYCCNPFVETRDDIRALNTVLKNAALLMNKLPLRYAHDQKSNFDKVFDSVQQIDVMLEKYFSLLDTPDRLSSYLQASSSSEWHGLSAADARTGIQKDLSNLAGFLARINNCGIPFFKKHRILDFDKRFVLQMTEQGLHWGASCGDMMHFDMRSSGVGKYIHLAIWAYKEKVKNLADRLFNEKRYGTHSP